MFYETTKPHGGGRTKFLLGLGLNGRLTEKSYKNFNRRGNTGFADSKRFESLVQEISTESNELLEVEGIR